MYTTQQPSYAPVYASNYIPPTTTINLDQEVKLTDSSSERDLLDSLAELYSIIRTLDGLEKAFQKDALSEVEYTSLSTKLIKQYSHILADKSVDSEFQDLDTFLRTWDLSCPRAAETLRTGLPRTDTFSQAHNFSQNQSQSQISGDNSGKIGVSGNVSGSLILAATENFITFLDALKLNYVTKAALHPLLSEVIQSVNKVTNQDFEHRGKIIQWLITLNQMRTTEELSEEQAGDLAFDMEQAYNGFKGIIS